jgi:Protein of unknown function (DUF3500)
MNCSPRRASTLLLIAIFFQCVNSAATVWAGAAASMRDAANRLLSAATPAERASLVFPFDSPERLNWHNIPRPRLGLRLDRLNEGTSDVAHQLIASGLSPVGFERALKVMSLEEVLYLIEAEPETVRRKRRDPGQYFISIFGEPKADSRWGWRLEGHHLSLNYVIDHDQVIASTPEFFGANPATFVAGKEPAHRVLAGREDLARQLVNSLTPEQQALAIVQEKIPEDLSSPGLPQAVVGKPLGVSAKSFTPAQLALIKQLFEQYAENQTCEVTAERLREFDAEPLETVYFAWWGGLKPFEPHHYRIQTSHFIAEYNSVQNSGNHIHSAIRSVQGDFGISR